MALTKIDDRGLKTPIDLLDNEKIRFGTGNDLEIYHNGTNSIIDNNTGSLQITAASFRVNNAANNEVQIKAVENSGVELFYDDTTKLSTTNSGVNITNGTSEALLQVIGGENQKGELRLVADDGDDNADKWSFQARTDGNLNIQNYNGGSWVNSAVFQGGAAVNLYYDNSKKFETNSAGVKVTGQLELSSHAAWPDHSSGYVGKAVFGSGDDLQIYHDGDSSYINHVTSGTDLIIDAKSPGDDLILRAADDVNIRVQGNETAINCIGNGAVELYYDGSKNFETTSTGATVTSPSHDGGLQLLAGNNNQETRLKIQGKSSSGTEHNWILGASRSADRFYVSNGSSTHFNILDDGKVMIKALSSDMTSADNTGFTFTEHATGPYLRIKHAGSGSSYANYTLLHLVGGTSAIGEIKQDGDGTVTYATSSDYRLKENIVDLTGAITRLKNLKPKRFNFKLNSGITKDGFLAHELQEVVPESVNGTKDEVVTADSKANNPTLEDLNVGDPVYQTADASRVVPLLTAALKEAITKIETLETKVAALESA